MHVSAPRSASIDALTPAKRQLPARGTPRGGNPPAPRTRLLRNTAAPVDRDGKSPCCSRAWTIDRSAAPAPPASAPACDAANLESPPAHLCLWPEYSSLYIVVPPLTLSFERPSTAVVFRNASDFSEMPHTRAAAATATPTTAGAPYGPRANKTSCSTRHVSTSTKKSKARRNSVCRLILA